MKTNHCAAHVDQYKVKADPISWKLGLLFAAEVLESFRLPAQAMGCRDAMTPTEGWKAANRAAECLGAASSVALYEGNNHPDGSGVGKEWYIRMALSSLSHAASRAQAVCAAAATLCLRANRDPDIVAQAEEEEAAAEARFWANLRTKSDVIDVTGAA